MLNWIKKRVHQKVVSPFVSKRRQNFRKTIWMEKLNETFQNAACLRFWPLDNNNMRKKYNKFKWMFDFEIIFYYKWWTVLNSLKLWLFFPGKIVSKFLGVKNGYIFGMSKFVKKNSRIEYQREFCRKYWNNVN